MNKNNKVLALKYRPSTFDELIGQEVMVETIKNSILSNKTPNAYLFTGIRGVGKTTTARIVAKALNAKMAWKILTKILVKIVIAPQLLKKCIRNAARRQVLMMLRNCELQQNIRYL